MTTALDLIESAALKLGAIQSGEALTADEGTDGLAVLNSMLDQWAIKKLLVYQIVQDSYTWASGNASRTIGSSGNFNGTRPTKIEGIVFRDSNNFDYAVRKIITDRREYDAITDKSVQSTIPEYVFYDPGYPLGTLYSYPVPSATMTCKIAHWQIIQQFTALTNELSLPPGYKWAIEHNLALALQPLFSLTAPPYVVAEAALSKKALINVNHSPVIARSEVPAILGGGRGSNILTDQ